MAAGTRTHPSRWNKIKLSKCSDVFITHYANDMLNTNRNVSDMYSSLANKQYTTEGCIINPLQPALKATDLQDAAEALDSALLDEVADLDVPCCRSQISTLNISINVIHHVEY